MKKNNNRLLSIIIVCTSFVFLFFQRCTSSYKPNEIEPTTVHTITIDTISLPLLFAGGASEQGNRSIASGAIGGMLFGVALGVFIVPVLFVIF